jgi:3'-phosphoadenosine 5'-phosphosulfate sulfotransferase (PAPS reductase)/FAD synthetase
MFIISASYGNDSIALIQWAHENKLIRPVTVVYIDTGWAAIDWHLRVQEGEELAHKYGFKTITIGAKRKFKELITKRKGFPSQQFQWCSTFLKGVPFMDWITNFDPQGKAWILIGKWRGESKNRKYTPHFIPWSEYHDNRMVWHPLCYQTKKERNQLIERAGMDILLTRSQECAPCVNAVRPDLLALSSEDLEKAISLERKVGKYMFRPYRFMGAEGIPEVMKWARSGRGCYNKDQLELCTHGMCGH